MSQVLIIYSVYTDENAIKELSFKKKRGLLESDGYKPLSEKNTTHFCLIGAHWGAGASRDPSSTQSRSLVIASTRGEPL